MAIKDLRPVVVAGLVRSGTARVVVDETRVAVVTKDKTEGWFHDGAGMVQEGAAPNKFIINVPDTGDGEAGFLRVVKAGGCTCGKPWLKQGSSESLLAGV